MENASFSRTGITGKTGMYIHVSATQRAAGDFKFGNQKFGSFAKRVI